MTLKEITRGMLYESVSENEINDAINSHNWVVINYDGTDNTHTDRRMIQPVAYGVSTAGNDVIRAFESFGDTKTSVPKWKYFRVDRISSWRNTGKTFYAPQPLFNPNGDRTMAMVYNIAKFDDGMSQAPTSSPKKKSELYRTDTERGLEKMRNQLKDPITLSDFKTQDGFGDANQGKQNTGPKTNKDAKRGADDVYANGYNYNVFDNSLSAYGSNARRNGHYYFQKRNKGKFARGSVLDDPEIDDTKETEEYLNTDHGNNPELEELRGMLGDTSEPMTLRDLKDRLGKR